MDKQEFLKAAAVEKDVPHQSRGYYIARGFNYMADDGSVHGDVAEDTSCGGNMNFFWPTKQAADEFLEKQRLQQTVDAAFGSVFSKMFDKPPLMANGFSTTSYSGPTVELTGLGGTCVLGQDEPTKYTLAEAEPMMRDDPNLIMTRGVSGENYRVLDGVLQCDSCEGDWRKSNRHLLGNKAIFTIVESEKPTALEPEEKYASHPTKATKPPVLTPNEQLALAIEVATKAHKGQFRKSGQPYILHPLRVMAPFTDDPLMAAVAVMHDVREDCNLSFPQLKDMGFDRWVVNGVEYLTRYDWESYSDYITALIKSGEYKYLMIKQADIEDNSQVSEQIQGEDPKKTSKRLMKYRATWLKLEKAIEGMGK